MCSAVLHTNSYLIKVTVFLSSLKFKYILKLEVLLSDAFTGTVHIKLLVNQPNYLTNLFSQWRSVISGYILTVCQKLFKIYLDQIAVTKYVALRSFKRILVHVQKRRNNTTPQQRNYLFTCTCIYVYSYKILFSYLERGSEQNIMACRMWNRSCKFWLKNWHVER